MSDDEGQTASSSLLSLQTSEQQRSPQHQTGDFKINPTGVMGWIYPDRRTNHWSIERLIRAAGSDIQRKQEVKITVSFSPVSALFIRICWRFDSHSWGRDKISQQPKINWCQQLHRQADAHGTHTHTNKQTNKYKQIDTNKLTKTNKHTYKQTGSYPLAVMSQFM